MNANLKQVPEQDRYWHELKELIPAYINTTSPDSATDLMHLIKEALNDMAISLPDGDETEELYKDLSAAVDVIESCMTGMELKYSGNSHKTACQLRSEAIGRFKFFANKLSA